MQSGQYDRRRPRGDRYARRAREFLAGKALEFVRCPLSVVSCQSSVEAFSHQLSAISKNPRTKSSLKLIADQLTTDKGQRTTDEPFMHRLRVTADKSAYDVVVGRVAWRALRRFPVARYVLVFVLTEQAMWNRWGKQFLRESGIKRVRWVFLPPSE